MEDEQFLKWFAGFFDADGSIYWNSQGKLVLNVSQSKKTVLENINSYYNNLFREGYRKKDKPDSIVNRTEFGITKTGKAIYPVLLDLKKYTIIKNPQITLALEYLEYYNLKDEKSRNKREEIGKKIKLFNNDHKKQECIGKRPYHFLCHEYIAGLLDGDGCVTIGENLSRYAKITQKNDPLILQKISELYDGSRYNDTSVVFEKLQTLRIFLNDVFPYLVYKKDQVQNLLEFLDCKDKEQRIVLKNKVKDAKKFDLDPTKYTQEIQNLFKDIEENYSTKDLMLTKKYQELKNCRITKKFDEQVFIDFDKIKEIKPKLIFCETKEQNSLWIYYRKRTSSIYFNGQIGRSIRILVIDENTKKYIGLLALGSDFYQISARDNWIKKHYPHLEVIDYINYIANITCCVPLQPFGYNVNGGKLLLKIAFSRPVYEYWEKKYNCPLLLITTLGVNGKSVMYDRLKEIKLCGYTKGQKSTIHIPEQILQKCKMLYCHLQLKNKRIGTMDILNTLFQKLKINVNYTKHITARSVYVGWVFNTKLDDKNPDSNLLETLEDITQKWINRWSKRSVIFKTKVELMDEKDDIFKNIKMYKYPSFSLNKGNVKQLQELPKKEKIKEVRVINLLCEHIKYLMTLKGKLTTEQASKNIKEKYNIFLNRNEISMLFTGQIKPPQEVINSNEYKKAMEVVKKRVYNNEKTEAWRNSLKSENRKATIDDSTLFKIILCKKERISAEECSKNFNYTAGKNQGKVLNRTKIQNIWTGKILPKNITKEYQELLEYKRPNLKIKQL